MPPYRIAPYPIQADHNDTITGTAEDRDLDCRFTSKPFKLRAIAIAPAKANRLYGIDRFGRILLKNSQIEQLRKSRSRTHNVV
jgi:hypothetical protein